MKAEHEIIDGQRVHYRSAVDMAPVADASIDVIVTSPPYNRGKVYRADDLRAHDDGLSERRYRSLLRRVFRECYRVLEPSGVFFLNIGDAATDLGKSQKVLELAAAAGFHHLQTVAWVKSLLGRGHYTPSGGSRRLNNIWENVFILVRDKKGYRFDAKAIGIPYADKSNIGRYGAEDLRDAGNVWLIPYEKTTGGTIKKGHDAPYPLALPLRCLKLVPEARRALDPFLGAGTTLAACKVLGIEGVGFELYPRRELIRQTIGEARAPRGDGPLLPHLDLAVRLLAEAVGGEALTAMLDRNARSASGRSRLKLLREVLDKLEAGQGWRGRLDEACAPASERSAPDRKSA